MGIFGSHEDTKAQREVNKSEVPLKHRHPELVSGSISQPIPAPVVKSQAVTRGCVFFRARVAAARWTLKRVQGDGEKRAGLEIKCAFLPSLFFVPLCLCVRLIGRSVVRKNFGQLIIFLKSTATLKQVVLCTPSAPG